ncbi:MAG: DHHA1 domain-containing protein [Methanomassiliicoccales archaeon]|nr:DHHA1 domain-containing protein [Methanomassiliicoccales archaeon]
MTILLYAADPYMTSFEARVVSVKGEWVELDKTAFYPGGGGQDPDLGVIDGMRVTELRSDDRILHRVPGHALTEGQVVTCSIDWDRRYDLMKGHTGEHVLFSALSRIRPGVELIKIAITPTRKSVMIGGDVNWDLMREVQESVNDSIAAGLPVAESLVRREDPSLKETRVKLDRIQGDEVRIVQIGDLDRAACAGIHVGNTSETGALLITKLVSAKPIGDFEIEFEVGDKAIRGSLDLASMELHAAATIGSNPRDLVSALANMKKEIQNTKDSLKKLSRDALRNIKPQAVGSVRLYAGLFDGIDKKALMDTANGQIREEKAACIFASKDDRLLLLVACNPEMNIDCIKIVNETLKPVGGKGGGQKNFAMGGAPLPEVAERVHESAVNAMCRAIQDINATDA